MNSEATMHSITNLLAEYAGLLDEDRLEEWLGLFAEEATYQVIPRENVARNLPASIILCTNKKMIRDRTVSLREANLYNLHYDRHFVSAIRVNVDGDGVYSVRANYAVYQTTIEGSSKLFSVGAYHDRVKMVGDRLLFIQKQVIVDTSSIPTLLATPL